MDRKNIIICDDGFVWKILSEEEAYKVFDSEVFELYQIHPDGSDSLISEKDGIHETLMYGNYVCIEVGSLPYKKKGYGFDAY